ncbi:MAG TPA: sulfatase [Acidimicrobiales bacterium]|nr:sulfatase [Acidimicrobiales bacterium]
MPANVVVVLLDSLNRHLIGPYGADEFDTPNLDRLARRAVRFDRHYTGSLPCMPARHDLLCGVLDFPWRPWGSIEIWEEPITVPLRRAGVTTVLVTDHPHLFEVGGENYHCDFTAWEYERGHEGDPWKTRPDPSWLGAPSFGRGWMPYDNSRGWFRGEEDFPGPRTMATAAAWLDRHARSHDRFFLLVDEFDPHEPFDTPEPYASMYDPGWEGPRLIWPPYTAKGSEVLSPDQRRHLRANYGAKLTMIDHWMGRILDAFDAHGLWEDTALVLCTDHGHYLGEKDVWGKPAVPVYETLGHIPLLVAWPGSDARHVPALTTNVDIFATVADVFGVQTRQETHGRSLVPILDGGATSVRDWALSGVWGREMHLLTDGYKYCRAPAADNFPLSMWSNRWSTMPVTSHPDLRLPLPDRRAVLDHMPGTDVPVIRQPFAAGDRLPFWALGRFTGNHLWHLDEDPDEDRDLAGTPTEKEMADALRQALVSIGAPDDQLARLGLD